MREEPVQKSGGGEGEKLSHAKVSSCEGQQGSEPAGKDDALKFVPRQIPSGAGATGEFVHEQIPGGSGESAGDAEGGKTVPANNKTGEDGAGTGDEDDGGRDTGDLTS